MFWIRDHDFVRAIYRLINHEELEGAVNLSLRDTREESCFRVATDGFQNKGAPPDWSK